MSKLSTLLKSFTGLRVEVRLSGPAGVGKTLAAGLITEALKRLPIPLPMFVNVLSQQELGDDFVHEAAIVDDGTGSAETIEGLESIVASEAKDFLADKVKAKLGAFLRG